MSRIDELFAQMEASGSHADAHDILLIDPVTRTIDIPDSEIVLGVEGDVRGERKYFGCPAVVGNDIALTNCNVHINYVNVLGEKGCFNVSGVDVVGDLAVFSWEISPKVVAAKGSVQFIICICYEVDGVVEKEWHTTLATGKVLDGMDEDNADAEEDSEDGSEEDPGGDSASAALGEAILDQLILN